MIERTERDGIVTLTLAHGKANALDLEMCERLGALLEEAGREDVRALVLTGHGRIFSAGVDLRRLLADGPEYIRAFLPAMRRAFRQALAYPGPMVAALNGHAVAGGCILGAAADYRILAEGARIGVPELRVGVPFPVEAIEILRAALPLDRFRTLVLGGAMLDAPAALDWRLADEVVPGEAVRDRAVAVAGELAATPRGTFRLTKRLMRAPALRSIEEDGAAGEAALLRLWTAPDTLRHVGEYVERVLGSGAQGRG